MKKLGYEDRSPRTKFIIDAYAMYHTPSQVLDMLESMRDEFPEDIPSRGTLANYKVKYADDIRARRAEISDKSLPILDPTWRFLRLQEIVEDAVGGIEVTNSRSGKSYVQKDFKAAISALAEVNKMTGFNKGNEDAEKEALKLRRQILDELRAELMKIPGAKPEEVEAIVAEKEKEFTLANEMVM